MANALSKLFNQPRTRNSIEEFPYWELHDGVMFLNDGRYEVGVEVSLPPTLFFESFEKLVADLKAALRNGVPEGQRLRFMLEVGPAQQQVFKDYDALTTAEESAAHFLTDHRAQYLFEHWQQGFINTWRGVISVTLGKKTKHVAPMTEEELGEKLDKAKKVQQALIRFLAQAGYRPRAMTSDEVFKAAYTYLNPSLRNSDPGHYTPTWQRYPKKAVERIETLRPPTLRAQLLKSDIDNSRSDMLHLGNRYLKIISLYTVPDETFVGMGDLFLGVGREFWLIVDLEHERYEKAIKALKGRARRFYAAASNPDTYVDPNVKVGLEESEGAITHISRTGDHVYKASVSLVIAASSPDELTDTVNQAMSSVASVPGNPFRVLEQGLWGPWKELAPFAGGQYEEQVALVETNAAHMFPTSGPWLGSERPVASFRNRYYGVTTLDPFDPRNNNWNGIIIGGSGSGKTFFTQYLLSEMLREDDLEVIIIDRGYGYAPLVELFDGAILTIETGGKSSINPFDLDEGQVEPDEDKKAFLLQILRAMVPGEGGAVESVENAILNAAIAQTYKQAFRSVMRDGQRQAQFEAPTLSAFTRTLITIDEIGDRPASASEKETARNLALRFQSWTGDSPLGNFVDRPTSVPLSGARVVYYETSAFESQPGLDVVGTMLMADLVWKRAKLNKDKRKVVVLDEAWAMLKNEAAVRFIVEMYRRFRRYNAAVWSVTQSLTDFQGDTARGILQNCTYHYLLRLPGEDELVRDVLKLNDRAMNAFRSLSGQKGKYSELLTWVRREDALEGDIVALWPSPIDYWAFTTNASDMAKRERLVSELGSLEDAIYALAYHQGKPGKRGNNKEAA